MAKEYIDRRLFEPVTYLICIYSRPTNAEIAIGITTAAIDETSPLQPSNSKENIKQELEDSPENPPVYLC